MFGLYSISKYPDMFNAQIDIDPSLQWSDGTPVYYLEYFLKKNAGFQNSVYVSKSKDMKAKETFNKLNDIMKNSAYKKLKYEFLDLALTESHSSAIVPTINIGLQKIFEEYSIYNYRDMTFEQLEAQYSKPILEAVYNLTETMINDFGCEKLYQKKRNEAIEIFKYNISINPNSTNVYNSLAITYTLTGDKELAITNFEKSLKIYPQNKNAIEQLKKLKEK
jgi:tetratricopeptide (TPR) repeat protein